MNTTIITSLYNIGRDGWKHWNRSHDLYLKYLSNVLSFKCNYVIYVDESDYDTVVKLRQKYDSDLISTKIIKRKFIDMECYSKFFEKTKSVMMSKKFIDKIKQKDTPEMNYPEYNIVNFNKIFLVNEVAETNPFNSEYFMWMDAGFYHHLFPTDYIGKVFPNEEKIKKLNDNKFHILSLVPKEYVTIQSYMDPTVTITGSWFAGKKEPLKEMKKLFIKVVEEFLESGYINDDQAIFAGCYMYNPDLFTLEIGNWFKSLDYYI